MIVDYHMHLRATDGSIDHSVDAVLRFVEAAAERGVDEIGFSEHVYYFRETRSLWSVPFGLELPWDWSSVAASLDGKPLG